MQNVLAGYIAGAAALLTMSGLANAQSGRVVLYNPGGAKVGQALADAFQKSRPGVTVDVINAGVGELFTRIKAERARPRGDVLMGASIEAFQSDADLFEPYKSSEDADFPREMVGKDSLYYGFDLLLQTLMINTKLMPVDQAPKSWKDLADPKYKGKIALANPSLSGSSYGQFAQVLQLHGWAIGEKLINNAVVVTSSQLVWQNVAKGEIAIGITGDNNVVTQAAAGFPVVAVYPSEGTALRFSANALIKGAPNAQNARALIDFLNSKAAHEISVDITSRRSARPDVKAPPGQIPNTQIKTFEYDDEAAAKSRDSNLRRVDDLISRK